MRRLQNSKQFIDINILYNFVCVSRYLFNMFKPYIIYIYINQDWIQSYVLS